MQRNVRCVLFLPKVRTSRRMLQQCIVNASKNYAALGFSQISRSRTIQRRSGIRLITAFSWPDNDFASSAVCANAQPSVAVLLAPKAGASIFQTCNITNASHIMVNEPFTRWMFGSSPQFQVLRLAPIVAKRRLLTLVFVMRLRATVCLHYGISNPLFQCKHQTDLLERCCMYPKASSSAFSLG